MWGIYTAGLTWRYYGTQRFVGGFGIDLEFLQQGFSFATNASLVEEPKETRILERVPDFDYNENELIIDDDGDEVRIIGPWREG